MTSARAARSEPPMALWLGASLLAHVLVVLAAFTSGGAWRAHVGEHGRGGAGGPVDEVSVTIVGEPPAAEADSAPVVASSGEAETDTEATANAGAEATANAEASAEAEAMAEAEAEASAYAEASAEGEASANAEVNADALVEAEANANAGLSSSVGTSSQVVPNGEGHAPADLEAPTGAGAGGEASADSEAARAVILGSAGRLEGSSVRASALLGESLACDDPIVGTWVAYRYSPEFRDWARFTLSIEREGAALRGTIVARMWRGLPSDRRPPPCATEGWDYTVTMRATGNLIGDRMAFGASTHEVTRVDCASQFFSYNPDHFSGRVDPLADRMHTVNNDGGRDVNAPYEFRRTRCE